MTAPATRARRYNAILVDISVFALVFDGAVSLGRPLLALAGLREALADVTRVLEANARSSCLCPHGRGF